MPLRLTISFIALWLSAFSSKAQTEGELLENGLKYAYNLNIEKADSLFNEVISLFPNSPSGYHYISQNHFWQYLGCKDEAELKIFESFNNLALERAEDSLKKKEDPFIRFILGSVYMLRAAVSTNLGDSWKAFVNAKNAVSEFEDVLKEEPKFADAYLGLGVFNYALSFVPGLLKFALDITGLDYDRQKALLYLSKAYNQGKFSRDEAAFHLSKVYFEYTGEYSKALGFIDELLKKYPADVLFIYQKALILIEQHKLNEAEALLKRVVELNLPKFTQTTAFSNFLLGDIYFKKNNFAKAVVYFEEYFNSAASLDYLGYANLRCALAYFFLNDEINYRRYIVLAGNGNLDIPEDKFAFEMSERLSGEKPSDKMAEYFIAENLYYAGEYDEVIKYADSLEMEGRSNASVLLMKAAAFVKSNDFDKALSVNLIKDNFIFDWHESFALLIEAEAFFGLNRLSDAERRLELAEDRLNGYRSNYIASQIYRLRSLIGN